MKEDETNERAQAIIKLQTHVNVETPHDSGQIRHQLSLQISSNHFTLGAYNPHPESHAHLAVTTQSHRRNPTPTLAKMSREQYQPPSLGGSSQQQASGTGTGGGFNLTGGAQTLDDNSKPVAYLCGKCDEQVTLKKGDAIRCKECGYRVLYKERTNRYVHACTGMRGRGRVVMNDRRLMQYCRMVQFEAR